MEVSVYAVDNTNITNQNGVVTSQQSLNISNQTYAIFKDIIQKEQTRIATKKTKMFLYVNNEFLIKKLNKLVELYTNSQISYNKQILLEEQIQITEKKDKNEN